MLIGRDIYLAIGERVGGARTGGGWRGWGRRGGCEGDRIRHLGHMHEAGRRAAANNRAEIICVISGIFFVYFSFLSIYIYGAFIHAS